MALSDIAEGLTVTTRQCERGVALVDATEVSLVDRLTAFADDLPCTTETAATVLDAYAGGASVGMAARAGGVAPVTGAKTLHLLGVDGLSPLSPIGQDVLRDWLDARCSRADALALTDASESEFALATFIETHDPLDGAREAMDAAFTQDGNAAVAKRDALKDAMPDAGDLGRLG